MQINDEAINEVAGEKFRHPGNFTAGWIPPEAIRTTCSDNMVDDPQIFRIRS